MTRPQHIAIIMDGNGRWAKQQAMPRLQGHIAGVKALRQVVEACARTTLPYLTVFAFSRENWQRPSQEVHDLMGLFVNAITEHVTELSALDIRLKFIGQRSGFTPAVISALTQAEIDTAAGRGLTLIIALDYSGRWDIEQACGQLLKTAQPNPAELAHYLSTREFPEPDLLIRTGGELRISNFYLWQAAYTELYFSDKLWPEFTEQDLAAALYCFAQRERRFGRVAHV